jgi:hypothetical protein
VAPIRLTKFLGPCLTWIIACARQVAAEAIGQASYDGTRRPWILHERRMFLAFQAHGGYEIQARFGKAGGPSAY